jgi:hypothetical protein
MADAVKVVAEAVGYRWMPEINEIAIYAKDLGDDGFDDVFAEDWYAEAVAFVRANGLMTGLDEVTFAPDSYFTYAMMAQVLYNLEGAPEVDVAPTFADVDPEGWYADAIAWAEINGITAGNADGSFTPDMIDFPTVHDGAEGVKFVHACLKSNAEGNVWVDL